MKVLIIGGTGILSSAVVNECINQHMEVTMLNRGTKKAFINSSAELIKCDVHDESLVLNKLKNRYFDAIIDFLVRTPEEIEYSIKLFGTIADQYIFISSAQAYNTSVSEVLNEKSKLIQPLWGYSLNKVICEKYVAEHCVKKQVPYTIIRPGVNYDNIRIPYGMFPFIGSHWTFVERIKSGKPIITWNKGQNKLNLTRVEDFALGAVGLIGNTGAYNEVFNVVGDYVYTWKEVLDTLGKLIGKEVKTIDIPVDFYAGELDGDTREGLLGGRSTDLVCSNAKLKKVVPTFKTKFKLEEGMAKTLDFYATHNYYQGFDYAWDGECDRIISDYLKSIRAQKRPQLKFALYFDDGNRINHKLEYLLNRYKYTAVKRRFYKILFRLHLLH